ncbi:hypothetical protein EZV62_008510 [Acer yangbiense]|uniref:CCHC-type domain-containing protein n=1 Tax=Acer yangbiense TaxID=1000413 RepID=A0A5C7IDW0_9ROSI|nr:hypothetical protein EZV62_008510 [Acer yangbiense]
MDECAYCHEKGHWKSACPKSNANKSAHNGSRQFVKPRAAIVTTNDGPSSTTSDSQSSHNIPSLAIEVARILGASASAGAQFASPAGLSSTMYTGAIGSATQSSWSFPNVLHDRTTGRQIRIGHREEVSHPSPSEMVIIDPFPSDVPNDEFSSTLDVKDLTTTGTRPPVTQVYSRRSTRNLFTDLPPPKVRSLQPLQWMLILHLCLHVAILLVLVVLLLGIQVLKSQLQSMFEMKDLGPFRYFLGIKVSASPYRYLLSQSKYAFEVVNRARMSDDRMANTLQSFRWHSSHRLDFIS